MDSKDNDYEDIKEEIVVDMDDDDETKKKNPINDVTNTYDKFLLESVAIDGKANEYHYVLKNQMKNIIDDIKEKQNQEIQNRNSMKKQILNDFTKLLNNNDNEDEEQNKTNENEFTKNNEDNSDDDYKNIPYNEIENEISAIENKPKIMDDNKINAKQYTFNPNQLKNLKPSNVNHENQNEEETSYNNNDNTQKDFQKEISNIKNNSNKYDNYNVIKDRGYLNNMNNNSNNNEVTESREYNINIDDFIRENTINDETDIVNNNITNNEYNENKNNVKYDVMGSPTLQKKIEDNYDCFSQKNKKNLPMNQQLTAKFNSLANPNVNNNINSDKKSEMIYIDDCKTEEERKEKQKKFEELKQKKLKELEEKINHKRAKSKPKTNNTNNNNFKNSNQNINLPNINTYENNNKKTNNNKPIVIRPRTSKSKPMTYVNNHKTNTHVAISAVDKEETQFIDHSNYSNNNNNIYSNNISKNSNNLSKNKNKKLLRAGTAKSNNINKTTNPNSTLMSGNSTLSRIPIKIEREESKLANKKVKNVHYSKMSNKKVIKKAISEVCLAGNANKEYRDKIIEIIDKCEFENYIILFRGNYGRFDIRAIYTYDIQNCNIELLTCMNNSPNFLNASMIATYYKYNISANQFKELHGTKDFSCIVDGVCLRK